MPPSARRARGGLLPRIREAQHGASPWRGLLGQSHPSGAKTPGVEDSPHQHLPAISINIHTLYVWVGRWGTSSLGPRDAHGAAPAVRRAYELASKHRSCWLARRTPSPGTPCYSGRVGARSIGPIHYRCCGCEACAVAAPCACAALIRIQCMRGDCSRVASWMPSPPSSGCTGSRPVGAGRTWDQARLSFHCADAREYDVPPAPVAFGFDVPVRAGLVSSPVN